MPMYRLCSANKCFEKGRRVPKQKENLNFFGEWINTLAIVLGVHWVAIGRRAGLNDSTIPQLSHTRYDKHPKRETFEAIWQAIQAIAKEKNVSLTSAIESGFFNGAGYSTRIQIETSGMILNALRSQHGLPALDVEMDHISEMALEVARQEIGELRYELRRKEARIAELEAELQKRRS